MVLVMGMTAIRLSFHSPPQERLLTSYQKAYFFKMVMIMIMLQMR